MARKRKQRAKSVFRYGMEEGLLRVFADAREMCGTLHPGAIDRARERVDALQAEVFKHLEHYKVLVRQASACVTRVDTMKGGA